MNPSRLNPRVGAAKKGENSSDLESSYAELFEENGEANKASLLSLINDTINRTPMGLIQVHFSAYSYCGSVACTEACLHRFLEYIF